ncbi:hypothetical protein BMS3Bbin04_01859 [bacterium BMS3Bbin04]|nr:hypothetical protein BMS3Bbin04_01859 [bacterium BMS3Bbin04]
MSGIIGCDGVMPQTFMSGIIGCDGVMPQTFMSGIIGCERVRADTPLVFDEVDQPRHKCLGQVTNTIRNFPCPIPHLHPSSTLKSRISIRTCRHIRVPRKRSNCSPSCSVRCISSEPAGRLPGMIHDPRACNTTSIRRCSDQGWEQSPMWHVSMDMCAGS